MRENFLRLVRLGIGHSAESLSGPVDWDEVEALATKQGLLGVVLDGIQQLPEGQRPPKVQMLQWIGQVVQGYEQRYVEYRKAIDSLATFYTANGFRMMLLKGYACGRDWPRPEHRPYGDIDIWLFGKQKEADVILAKETGIVIDSSHHHHTVFNWMGFTVENHYDFVNVHALRASAEMEKVFKELGYHHVDIDGNFADQLQSINGFDARIWELYLWCYFREEDFEFDTKHDAPDFMLKKWGEEVAVEAVHIKRTQSLDEEMVEMDIKTIFEKLRNEMPLMFGSSLYSKLKHEYQNQKYWELPHVKDKPLVFAIADFHADMSMTWSFPAITSIIYGVSQMAEQDEDGKTTLVSAFGEKYTKKNKVEISPLFLNDEFKHVSAVLFSPCGTITKFNRMGVQAGYGDRNYTLLQMKICYNHLQNALYPNVFFNVIDETCNETWADGIQIFHNPMAEIPLNPALFPHAGHHFYKDGLLYSDMPKNSTISTMTWNIKNMPVKMRNLSFHTKDAFDQIVKQYNL